MSEVLHVSLTDETLIKDAAGEDIATTFFGETDYRDQYEKRSADADMICKWVNGGPRLVLALRALISIAGFPITDRQKAVFDEARAALSEVGCGREFVLPQQRAGGQA